MRCIKQRWRRSRNEMGIRWAIALPLVIFASQPAFAAGPICTTVGSKAAEVLHFNPSEKSVVAGLKISLIFDFYNFSGVRSRAPSCARGGFAVANKRFLYLGGDSDVLARVALNIADPKEIFYLAKVPLPTAASTWAKNNPAAPTASFASNQFMYMFAHLNLSGRLIFAFYNNILDDETLMQAMCDASGGALKPILVTAKLDGYPDMSGFQSYAAPSIHVNCIKNLVVAKNGD